MIIPTLPKSKPKSMNMPITIVVIATLSNNFIALGILHYFASGFADVVRIWGSNLFCLWSTLICCNRR